MKIDKRNSFVVGILTSAFVLIIFLPSLNNGFVNWDDSGFVYENLHIRQFNLDFFRWIFFNQETQWSPLRWISHAIDYRIWGLNPFGHHLTSIIFHSINTFLVIILVERLAKISLKAEGKDRESRIQPLMTGVITGLLFGIHPLRVESVVWISERKDVLYGFFYLMSIICYIRHAGYAKAEARSGKRGASPLYYILSLTFFLMSVMSKSMAMTLPFIILLIDVYPLERMKSSASLKKHRLILIEKIPFFILSAFSVMVTLTIHEEFIVHAKNSSQLASRIIMPFRTLSFYLYKSMLPINLAPIYPYSKSTGLVQPTDIGSILLITVLTVISILLWKRGKKRYLTLWVFYVVTLLPISGIIKIGRFFAADRYTYLASIGPFIMVAAGIALLWNKGYKKGTICTVASTTVILSLLTVRQGFMWKDSMALWTAEIKAYPYNSTAHYNRGNAYYRDARYKKAIYDYNRAITLLRAEYADKPPIKYSTWHADVYNSRGTAYKAVGDYNLALSDLNKAIRYWPKHAEALSNRATVYMEMKEYDKALKDVDAAIQYKRGLPEAHYNRANILEMMGSYSSALKEFRTVIEMSSDMTEEAHRKRCGIYLTKLNRYKEAVTECSTASSLKNDDLVALNYRAIAYTLMGKFKKAIDDYSRIISIKPDEYRAYSNRANVFLKAGMKQEAAKDLTKADEIRRGGAVGFRPAVQ